jgi:hypothetical protein
MPPRHRPRHPLARLPRPRLQSSRPHESGRPAPLGRRPATLAERRPAPHLAPLQGGKRHTRVPSSPAPNEDGQDFHPYRRTPPSQSTGMGQESTLFTQLPPHHLIIMVEVSQTPASSTDVSSPLSTCSPPPSSTSCSSRTCRRRSCRTPDSYEWWRPKDPDGPVGTRLGPHLHHHGR